MVSAVIAAIAALRAEVSAALVGDGRIDPDLRGKFDARPGDWSARGRRVFVAGALLGWDARQIADNILGGGIHPAEDVPQALAERLWSRWQAIAVERSRLTR